MHPRAENDAMIDLEKAIKALRNILGDRGMPKEKLKKIKTDTKQCNYASAIHECMKHIQSNYRGDKKVALFLCSACRALLVYHDLRYDRASEEFRQGITHGLWPAWYQNYKQRRVEHHRKVVNYCLKWSRVAENVQFQIILKEDNLVQKQKEIAAAVTRAMKLASIKQESDKRENDVASESLQLVIQKEPEQHQEKEVAFGSTCLQLVVHQGSKDKAPLGSTQLVEYVLFKDEQHDNDNHLFEC